MSPKEASSESAAASSWPVRRRLLEEHELEVSAEQVADFERVGLIEREDGLWPVSKTVQRIRAIHDAMAKDRRLLPLSRRVLYLRATNYERLFDIPDAKVVEALLAMPRISRSYQKLQRVRAAYARLADHASEEAPASDRRARAKRPRLPREPAWRAMLVEAAHIGSLGGRLPGFFHWDRLFQLYGAAIDDIPPEERIYLIAVVDTWLMSMHVPKFIDGTK